MDNNNSIESVPDLEEVSMEEAIEQHLQKPIPQSNTNPLLHAYSKQLQNENKDTKLDVPKYSNVSQQSNEQTTDFFSSLNRLAGFSSHNQYNGITSCATPGNSIGEDEAPLVSSSSKISATSSGIFSSSTNRTFSSLLTDDFSQSSSSNLLIVNGGDKGDDGDSLVEVDESEIETIEITKETKRPLLIEVCQILISIIK